MSTHTHLPLPPPTGDAYRFTLRPIFASLRHEFRCHVTHAPPPALYRLWFYLSVPEVGYETGRVERSVSAADLGGTGAGRYQAVSG